MSAQSERPVGVAIIGSTGSIGQQACDVIARSGGAFRIIALCANSDDATMAEQIQAFRPQFVGMRDEEAAARLRTTFGESVSVASGDEAMVEAACLDEVDVVLVSVVGFAGVKPTLAALERGKRVALANKETLVAAGDLVMAKVSDKSRLLPVDSEHTAIFQTLEGRPGEVERVILTASGGPFRHSTVQELERVTASEALQHPTWSMGGKITIDSATLMNKGFEVLEAIHLFRLDLDQVGVVVHPQSLVHSLVEFKDGSLLAQMAVADMRLPIAYALWYPRQAPWIVQRLDVAQLGKLEFEPPDTERFPCLRLAMEAGRIGGTMPTVLNAANEVAVSAFLQGRIGFVEIPRLIERVMEQHQVEPVSLDAIFASDGWARKRAQSELPLFAR